MTTFNGDALPPTTAPDAFQISVQGFSNTEAAKQLGETVGELIRTLGSFIDLAILDGVTIGIDYDAALASVDQGVEGLSALDRTNTEELQGVAKTCPVLRDGVVKSHLVFNAVMLVPLIAEDGQVSHEDVQSSVGIIAHECAHVEIGALMMAKVPEARFGAQIAEFERAMLFPIAEVCWDEYAVCRLSARFASQQNVQHAESILAVTPEARVRAELAVRAYRDHGEINRLLSEAGSELLQPMKAVAYLLGGLDADDLVWADFPAVRAAIEEAGYADLVDRMHEQCRRLWDTRGSWSEDQDVLEPLIKLARDVFASGGIHLSTLDNGLCRVDVP
ncbi:hypothetical protein [Brevundimonas sp.]